MEQETESAPLSVTITSPANNAYVRNAEIDVAGTTSITLPIVARMYQGSTKVAEESIARPNGPWSIRFKGIFAPGQYRIEFTQSGTVTIVLNLRVTPVTITSPNSGEVADPRFEVKGSGGEFGVGTVTLHKSADGALLGTATISANGTWSAMLTLPSETQPLSFYARQKIGTYFSLNSNSITVSLSLTNPVITSPPANSLQPTTFTLAGNGGRSGGRLQVFLDLTNVKVGESTVSGANWQCPVTVSIGRVSLVARQFWNGKESSGTPRVFDIPPPALTRVDVAIAADTVKFSGSGHTGATVEIRIVSGPDGAQVPPAVEVRSGTWETTAARWPLGNYRLSAIQRVPNNAGGWIASPPFAFDVSRVEDPVPDPTDVVPDNAYTPSFFGRGVPGATVLSLFPDGSSAAPEAPVINGAWSSRSTTEWGPTFERVVHFKQRLNGQVSPGLVSIKVKIPPLAPVISGVENQDLSPFVTGSCWPGAVVQLVFSNRPTVYNATVNGGQWQFLHPEKFAPDVTHTVTVTQTAAQQTSTAASQTFEFGVPLTQPVITDPQHETEVSRHLMVHGTHGTNGAWMQLRVDGIDTGPPMLMRGGLWSIDLTGLAFGRRILDAQQTLDGRPSERSDPVAVTVVLMPPVFTVPQPGGKLPRMAMIAGEGMPGALIEVWLEGREDFLIKDAVVRADGGWGGSVMLPVGVTTLRARQSMGREVSRDSPPLTFAIVPAAPAIETPVMDGHIGRATVVSGFGEPGDRVTISLDDAAHTVLGSGPVLEDRTWSVPVMLTQPGGVHVLMAVASFNGYDSDAAAQRLVLGSYAPQIDTPQAGRWVTEPVHISGQGRQGMGQVTSWYNPEHLWTPFLEVSTQGWQGWSVRPLAAGGNWCRFKQTIVDGADQSTISDWVQSQRFEVSGPPPR